IANLLAAVIAPVLAIVSHVLSLVKNDISWFDAVPNCNVALARVVKHVTVPSVTVIAVPAAKPLTVSAEPADGVTMTSLPAILCVSVLPENVCAPVHVGAIDTSSFGAASDRMYVAAVPLAAVSPTLPVGFAAPGTDSMACAWATVRSSGVAGPAVLLPLSVFAAMFARSAFDTDPGAIPTPDRPLTVSVFVFLLNDHVTPPPSAIVRPRAFLKKLLVRGTELMLDLTRHQGAHSDKTGSAGSHSVFRTELL